MMFMFEKLTAKQLYDRLNDSLLGEVGKIVFDLAGVSVKIDTTDSVGITLQSWLKQYLSDNNIYFSQPLNTQEFPDFFLDNSMEKNLLEVKSFNCNATPAFDIANFDSYCSSIKNKPYHLDADYLIFGYVMNDKGDITIKKLWLLKVWQIAGTSDRFPLKTQVKKDVIYNIRPNSDFKKDKAGVFKSKDDFLYAIYETLVLYKSRDFADEWKSVLATNYEKYYGVKLPF